MKNVKTTNNLRDRIRHRQSTQARHIQNNFKMEPETSTEQEIELTIVIDSTNHRQMNDQQEMPQLTNQQEVNDVPEAGDHQDEQ